MLQPSLRHMPGLPWICLAGAVTGAGIAFTVALSCSAHVDSGAPRSGATVVAAPSASPSPSPSPSLASPEPGPGTGDGAGDGTAPHADDPVLVDDPPCDFDYVATHSRQYYTHGFARPALQLALRGLACQEDGRLYRLAAFYACAAQDAKVARKLYRKVPSQFQPGIQQRCSLENIALP